VSLDDPLAVAFLLRDLGSGGASDAVAPMVTQAAVRASLDNVVAVAELLVPHQVPFAGRLRGEVVRRRQLLRPMMYQRIVLNCP
jgi:hypothetical protein